MFSFFKKRVVCPYCLAEIRGINNQIEKCPKCGSELPVQYVHEFEDNPPFFAQVFGWSQVGKTVFLYALTLMLEKMSNVWPNYVPAAANDPTMRKTQEINEYLAQGVMPDMTDLGPQEVYIMILRKMPRWGGRTLVTRDCAGEIFDTMQVPIEQAPYLINTPVTFMLVSLSDLPNSGGRTMDMLMNNYINTLMKHGVNFKKHKRKLVVVFSKADIIPGLPSHLRNYLVSDPIWASVNKGGNVPQMGDRKMQEYMEKMGRVSKAISDWIRSRNDSGKRFLRMAEHHNIDMRFSLISSTGADVGPEGEMPERLAPRRVLDPYFWALELQSR